MNFTNVRRAGSPASLDPRAALFLSRAGSGHGGDAVSLLSRVAARVRTPLTTTLTGG